MRYGIRNKLIEAAKKGEVIFYSELDIGRGKTAGAILGEIAEYEHNSGHPLLTALVVNKNTGMPSEGFWGLSAIPSDLTNRQRPVFWAEELIKVVDYWQRHLTP